MNIKLALTIILFLPLQLLACPKVDFSCDGNYKVHLSFDDGPNANTERILWVLKKSGVKASFYLLGSKLINADGSMRRGAGPFFKIMDKMKREGHTIGSHTYQHIHHYNHKKWKASDYEKSILRKEGIDWRDNISIIRESNLLEKYLNNKGKIYYRLPYGQGWFEAERKGKKDTEVLEHLLNPSDNKQKAFHVGWDIDSSDWRDKNEPMTPANDKKFLQDIAKQICNRKGGIVLMHDHTQIVSRNLSCLISNIKSGGHKFTDIDNFRHKRSGQSGPQIVMGYDDIAGVDHRDCDSTGEKDELDKNEDLLDQLIEKIISDQDYTPEDVTVFKGDIYQQRDQNGSMKYKHLATFKSYPSVDKLLKSDDFKTYLTKNKLRADEIIYFITKDKNIQIGTVKQ